MENRNPLKVYCRNCGAPAGFDILNQTYRCAACGETTGIAESKQQMLHWRTLQKDNTQAYLRGQTVAQYACSSCGATVVFEGGEASQTCDFCGSKLVRKELTDADQLPELIIPFFITPEEARQRLLDWGHKYQHKPEGRSVVSSMGQFKGYYLPYQLVKGPVYGEVTRDSTFRKFRVAGYLEGTAVSTSKQLDNLVLNEAEPFDWSQARPFELGYIAGHHVKLSDISDADTAKRVNREVEAEFLPEVRKVMQTSGCDVNMNNGELDTITVLLPMYFIKVGKLTAVLNGQTGRIAVSGDRVKKSFPWVIEPLLGTLLCTLLLSIPYHFALEPMFLFVAVFGCIFFAAMGEGRTSLIESITMRSRESKATREKEKLHITEGNDILKNPYGTKPVFIEFNEKKNRDVPAKIKFYSVGRWLSILWNIFILVMLPAILAAGIRLLQISESGEAFMDGYKIGYGAAWYVLAGMIALIYWIRGVRSDVYNHPIVREILPGGKTKLMGRRADRRVSVFSLFGIGERDKDGKRITLLRALWDLRGLGFFLGGTLLFILLGSTLAIVY